MTESEVSGTVALSGNHGIRLADALSLCACSSEKFTMVTTTENAQWVEVAGYNPDAPGTATDIIIDMDAKGQTMQGFGACL